MEAGGVGSQDLCKPQSRETLLRGLSALAEAIRRRCADRWRVFDRVVHACVGLEPDRLGVLVDLALGDDERRAQRSVPLSTSPETLPSPVPKPAPSSPPYGLAHALST